MTVTVVSCVYGPFTKFIPRWRQAISQLDPAPDMVVVATDTRADIPGATVVRRPCFWQHQQAGHLQRAIDRADTEWVWILDIDDIAHTDALEGLDEVWADVWLAGFDRSDGVTHIPPILTNADYLALDGNPYPAGSFVRRDVFDRVGFRDIAFQDWGLWRDLAHWGAVFEVSGRTHYRYMRHPAARGETELTRDRRDAHLEEMLVAHA